MSAQAESNAAERRRWNDEYWTRVWPRREQLTNTVTELVLAGAALRRGERVLDIGSGGGTSALAAARVVGEEGSITGADISAPLAAFATRRAEEQGVTNVSLHVLDVQQDPIPAGPFDVAISQFGVMFFEQPVTAFANIHHHMTEQGRLAFACWQAVERNPWFIGPALAGFVSPPPPPAPGKSPTGPFTLAEEDGVRDILDQAGWSEIALDRHEVTVTVDRDAIVDDGQLRFLGVEEAKFEAARSAVDAHLAPLTREDGRIDAPLAFQIVTARA